MPSQSGNSGKYLTTNGTAASWDAVASSSASTLPMVASGAISAAGKGLALNSNGTVFEIKGASYDYDFAGNGIFASTSNSQHRSCYDASTGVFFDTYNVDGGLGGNVCTVDTANGTVFPTAKVINSTGNTPDCYYDSGQSKVVVVYRGASNYVYARVVTTTNNGAGSAPSFVYTGETYLNSGPSAEYCSCTYDSVTGKGLALYQASSGTVYGVVLSVSGTSISVGSTFTITTAVVNNYNARPRAVAVPGNKFVVCWYGTGTSTKLVVVNISGTTLSISGSVINSGSGTRPCVVWHSGISRVCLTHVQGTSRFYRSLSISGNTLTNVGSLTVTQSSDPESVPGWEYSPEANVVGFFYIKNIANNIIYPRFHSIDFGTDGSTIIQSAEGDAGGNQSGLRIGVSLSYNPVLKIFQAFKGDTAGFTWGSFAIYPSFTNLLSTTLMAGISNAAAANGATTQVSVQGSTNSNFTSLQIGAKYWINDTGSFNTSDTGFQQFGTAFSATTMLMTEAWTV